MLAALGGAVLGAGWSAGLRAEPQRRERPVERPPSVQAPTSMARHFSARLAIRHRRTTVDGTPLRGPVTDVRMRVVREHRGGRWHTSLTVERPPEFFVDLPGGPVRAENPFLVVRAELDDGEDEPRLYDRQGRRVAPMSAADLQVLGVARSARGDAKSRVAPRGPVGPPASAWLAEAGRHRERRDDLERTFGAPVGRLRGLDRYVAVDDTARQEALVTPDTALPVQVSTTMADGADLRTEVDYEPYGNYGYVRRLMRSSQRFAQVSFGRAETEVELTDVVISDEVAR
jgi:hypothetical protein